MKSKKQSALNEMILDVELKKNLELYLEKNGIQVAKLIHMLSSKTPKLFKTLADNSVLDLHKFH